MSWSLLRKSRKSFTLGKITFLDTLNLFYSRCYCNFQNTFHVPAELFYQKNIFLQYILKSDFLTEHNTPQMNCQLSLEKHFFFVCLVFSPCEVIQEIMPSGAFHGKKKKKEKINNWKGLQSCHSLV